MPAPRSVIVIGHWSSEIGHRVSSSVIGHRASVIAHRSWHHTCSRGVLTHVRTRRYLVDVRRLSDIPQSDVSGLSPVGSTTILSLGLLSCPKAKNCTAQSLDDVRNVVLTTGTPPSDDRGATILCETVEAIKTRTELPIQAQCEPPADFHWFHRLREAGVASSGMHLQAWNESVRREIMPGKAEVAVAFYLEAFAAAVAVFGRGQVSTYLLAGLGDSAEELLNAAQRLIELGVYPFIVPLCQSAEHPWRIAGHRLLNGCAAFCRQSAAG